MTCHKHMYSESWHKALNSALLPFSTHCLLDLNVHWKDWCWSWSNTLATWCEELTHWERPWYWEGLRAEEGDEMVGWHHWLNGHVCVCVCVWVTQLCLTLCDPMDCNLPVSSLHGILHARTWVWANSRREWSTGKLGLLQFMGTQLSNWKKPVFCTDRMNWEYTSGLSVLNGQKITQKTPALPLPLRPHLIFSIK